MKVLFVGETDSTVSQIAKALLKRLNPAFRVYSAGLTPCLGVHPFVHRVLGEGGLPLVEERPRLVEAFTGERFDFVVSLTPRPLPDPLAPQGGAFRHLSLTNHLELNADLSQHLAWFRRFKALLGEKVTELYLNELRPLWENRV